MLNTFSKMFLSSHFAVPNGYRTAVGDSDQTQQQSGSKVCQQEEQVRDAAAARGMTRLGMSEIKGKSRKTVGTKRLNDQILKG